MAAEPRLCDSCGSRYQPLRSSSRYCSGRCRKRAQRSGLASSAKSPTAAPETTGPAPELGPAATAAVAELNKANLVDSALGIAYLIAAQRLDASANETGAAFAAVSREFRAARNEALQDSAGAGDALDEIARKREERMRRAGG